MKRYKFFISFLIVFFVSFTSSYSYASNFKQSTEELNSKIQSEAVLIMESSTGKVIYEKNGYQVKYPASTTKILTAILAIENCEMDEIATASEFAINSIPYDYSIAEIKVGEKITVKDLLYALMIHSANEAAYILAEHIGGSNERFAEMMNEKAKEIGCKNSHFVNPNGIQDENHYSTAYDLALITRYAMQNNTFREIVKTTEYTLSATDAFPYETRHFTNTNHLIMPTSNGGYNQYYYPYAIGVKTGYTSAAQNCLVSAAVKNGIEYISVVLGATYGTVNGVSTSYRYTDSISLFEYAFANFTFKELSTENEFLETIDVSSLPTPLDVATKDTISALVNIDVFNSDIKPQITVTDGLRAPIKKGDVIGLVTYNLGDETYTSELVSMDDIEAPLLEQISSQLKDYSGYYVLAGILLIIGISGLLITIVVVVFKKRRARRNMHFELNREEIIRTDNSDTASVPEHKEEIKKETPIPENDNNEIQIHPRILPEETINTLNTPDDVEDDDLSGELSSEILKENKKTKNKRD